MNAGVIVVDDFIYWCCCSAIQNICIYIFIPTHTARPHTKQANIFKGLEKPNTNSDKNVKCICWNGTFCLLRVVYKNMPKLVLGLNPKYLRYPNAFSVVKSIQHTHTHRQTKRQQMKIGESSVCLRFCMNWMWMINWCADVRVNVLNTWESSIRNDSSNWFVF